MMYLKKNLKNLKKKYLQYDGDWTKNAEDAEKQKEGNSLNLQNQLFIISIHLPR
jgi:hypothetical protein